ncbi:MltA domain-containing protein [Jannaschia seohaensis]|uniref:peptidoglycan lytic exotransglycosylase n=1 Tax=Jannaschia seohaensis TaxID=475081 RepID=A0A2Y9A159_9RHOB|nr:MltA domain-containing protein [Jannaschia seohaensis]PWJ21747.1 membrane-bound lytic murein transglycosylase A [Jannaschia seohaensis]SSA38025.1 membrane-bound lytic murein transglycosylase A [Jannaschia seohaensis]
MTARPDPTLSARAPFVPPDGWDGDDLEAALAAFRRMEDHPLAEAARTASSARAFFETRFTPARNIAARITGYYEPELDASLTRTLEFPVPVHALPDGGCSLRRSEIDTRLNGYVLAWLRDEVDRFFLQVQGSGRLRLADGSTLRLGYGGGNGHAYRSIGQILIERQVFGMDLTAEQLKDWLRADPTRGRALMDENPSYVFFRVQDGPPEDGPIGTMGCPVTAGRSVACDPAHTPLGTPVWIHAPGVSRLCIAQDTGSAIKGPGRLDLFHGTGAAAGEAAGEMNLAGRMTPLMPR